MASNGVDPTTGSPRFPETDAPQTGADYEEVADYAVFRGNTLKGTATEMNDFDYPIEGMLWSNTTDGDVYRYDGSSWVLLARVGGMYRITPDSVTGSGVTIGSEGEVILTATPALTSIQIRGVFSSLFRHYRIYTKSTAKVGAGYTLAGVVGTSAIGGTSYSRTKSGMVSGVTIAANQDTGQATFGDPMFGSAGSVSTSVMDVMSPNAAEATQILSQIGLLGGATGIEIVSSNLNSTDQLTGLQIVCPGSGTTTAEIRIFGVT
jgi:hypothetical protein